MTAAWIREILEQYGQRVTVETAAGTEEVRAFLQPWPERGEADPETWTSLGAVDGRLWRYLGQAAVETGDRIIWEGHTFRVRSSRPYDIGGTRVYWWAVLERAKEAAE